MAANMHARRKLVAVPALLARQIRNTFSEYLIQLRKR
jgi:hypothetical protein